MKTAVRRWVRGLYGQWRPILGRAGPCGVLVSDLIFLLSTLAAFAVLGLLVRGVAKL